jgi:hypothetical protein
MKKPLKQIQSTLQSFTDDKNKTVGFLNEKEVQEYAPGSASKGRKLKEPYKIPLPGSKNLIYLLAKSADVIMMCSKFTSNKGNVLGFEHLTHEIWVDNNQLP